MIPGPSRSGSPLMGQDRDLTRAAPGPYHPERRAARSPLIGREEIPLSGPPTPTRPSPSRMENGETDLAAGGSRRGLDREEYE